MLSKIKERLVDVTRDDGKRGHVSGVPKYTVDRTVNLLQTGLLKSAAKAVPVGNVEQIATDVGFATQI